MRRSLFGPMLLIAAGGLLLARNFNVEFPLGELFAQHWPWILIVWGGFRFLEAAAAAVRNRRGPRALGVGAVLFACLICILGSAARS